MSDEEAKNAFNQNMIAGGMLSNGKSFVFTAQLTKISLTIPSGPAEFGKFYDRRWLATDYEAGDVVLHNAYAVSVADPQMELIFR